MKRLLVGSSAIRQWFSDFPREPKDVDFIVKDNAHSTLEVEEYVLPFLFDYEYGPSLILTLKASHLAWNIQWWKHAYDVRFLLNKGIELNVELFNRLFDFWSKYHYIRKCNFETTKDTFFQPNIHRIHDHDTLHEIVNYDGEPKYKLIVPEGVKPLPELYAKITDDDRVKIAKEECYVIALERVLIPNQMQGSAIAAYKMALQRLFTSLAPDWMIIYLIPLIDHLWLPDLNYKQIYLNHEYK